MFDTGLMLTLFLAAVVIAFIFKGIVVIRSSERMVIERFGNYVHTLEPGINFIIPFVDRPREFIWKKAPSDSALSRLLGEGSDGMYNTYLAATARIDIRETVLDMPSQTVFTKDNVSVHINALLYIEITNPHDAVYRISNLPNAIEKLTQTTLRSLVGEMELDKTLSSREQINSRLQIILDEAADDWGAKVKRVEIQDLEVPDEIQAAMEKQMRAERDKRAAILEADGEKEALNKLKESLGDEFSQYLLAVRYLETMNHIGAQTEGDKTIFMPMDATATLGAIGGIQELFKGKS